jgi:hypothetical protein
MSQTGSNLRLSQLHPLRPKHTDQSQLSNLRFNSPIPKASETEQSLVTITTEDIIQLYTGYVKTDDPDTQKLQLQEVGC